MDAVPDHDDIAVLVLEGPLCLGCIAAKARMDRLSVERILVDLARLDRITSAPGRCHACRAAEIVFRRP
jgi:hypothetical protein